MGSKDRDWLLNLQLRAIAKAKEIRVDAHNALKRLQCSLDDAEECLSTEVLCAVHLLGIFDVSLWCFAQLKAAESVCTISQTLMRGDKETSQTHRQGVC